MSEIPSPEINDQLIVVGGVFGTIGVINGVRLIYQWLLAMLPPMRPQYQRLLASGVAGYAALTLGLTQVAPLLSYLFGGVFVMAMLSTLIAPPGER